MTVRGRARRSWERAETGYARRRRRRTMRVSMTVRGVGPEGRLYATWRYR